MKKITIYSFINIILVSLAGCFGDSSNDSNKSNMPIEIIGPNNELTYWEIYGEGPGGGVLEVPIKSIFLTFNQDNPNEIYVLLINKEIDCASFDLDFVNNTLDLYVMNLFAPNAEAISSFHAVATKTYNASVGNELAGLYPFSTSVENTVYGWVDFDGVGSIVMRGQFQAELCLSLHENGVSESFLFDFQL